METHIDNNDYRRVDARELTEDDVQARVAAIDAKAWSRFEKTAPTIDDQITALLSNGWLLDNERHRTFLFRKQKPYPRAVQDRSGRIF